MANISMFNGIFYDAKRAGDISKLVSPCLSEVNSEMRAKLAAGSRNNIVRVLRPMKDKEGKPDFLSSRRLLDEMLKDGILKPDKARAMYRYTLSYADEEGQMRSRIGFYCLVEASAYGEGKVLPHERTFPDAVRQWANLSASTNSDLSAVFGLFEDRDSKVLSLLSCSSCRIVIEFSDPDGNTHSLCRMEDGAIAQLKTIMAEKTVVIADGHHRFEAAKEAVQNGQRAGTGVLSCLFPMDSVGIQVRPFHRHLKGIPPSLLLKLPGLIQEDFIIKRHGNAESLRACLKSASPGSAVFGAYSSETGFISLVFRLPRGKCSSEVLHEDLLARHLEFGRLPFLKDEGQGNIVRARVNFTPSMEACIRAVESGYSQIAFFTVPPTARQVFEAALSGRLMPEKTTCFHPKPIEGLLISSYSN